MGSVQGQVDIRSSSLKAKRGHAEIFKVVHRRFINYENESLAGTRVSISMFLNLLENSNQKK